MSLPEHNEPSPLTLAGPGKYVLRAVRRCLEANDDLGRTGSQSSRPTSS